MAELSSASWRLKRVRRLATSASERAQQGSFVIEGPRLVSDAVAAGLEVSEVYVSEGAPAEAEAAAALAVGSGATSWVVRSDTLDRIGDARTSSGVLALATCCDVTMAVLGELTFVLVLGPIGDPGNAGTLIRAAEAAGADAVVIAAGAVDVFNPKVVRATAGTLFSVPIVRGVDLSVACGELAARGLQVVGTDAGRGEPHWQTDLTGPVALVLGHETRGVPADLAVDAWIRVPIRGRAESLNVAMAGAVLCFEVARQHEAAA